MATHPEHKKNRHITPKVLLSILIALLLLIGIFMAIDYSHYAKDKSPYRTLFIPRLEVSLFQITTLTADKTNMVGSMMIHNPLPLNLRADSLRYEIYISGVEVLKSTYAQSLNIKRWDTTMIDLPVTAYNDKLFTVLGNAEKEGKDSVEYEVKAYFGTSIIFHKDFNLDIKTLQPVIYIPKLKITSIEYDSLKDGGVTLYLNTEITNKNKFPMKIKDLNFKVAIADDAWIKGSKGGVVDILDSGQVTSLTLPLRISFKEIGKSLGPMIRHGKNTNFKLVATFKLVSDNNALKNSEVVLTDNTVIHEIVKLIKDEVKKGKDKKALESPEQKKQDKEDKKKNKIHFGKKK